MEIIIGKKGQVQNMAPAIIALVLAATLLIFGLIATQSLRDTGAVRGSQSNTIINETVTTATVSGDLLTGITAPGANGFTIILVTNASNGVIVQADNYTVTDGGLFSLTSPNLKFNNTNLNVTYGYAHGGEAYRSANLTIVGLGSMADFWEIIVLAIVITIVIGLLLVVFGGSRNR